MFGAYVHFRPDGEAFYVGKGREKRSRDLNRPHNPHHGNIVAKYGKENILISFMPCSTESAAFDLEIGLIKTFIRNGVKLTNLTDGGEGVSGLVFTKAHRANLAAARKDRIFTPETRAKIGAAHIGNQHCTGKTLSAETKAKIGAAGKGRRHTPEAKAKMSIAAKGRIFTAEHCANLAAAKQGRKLSEETKQKMSSSHFAYFAKLRATEENQS